MGAKILVVDDEAIIATSLQLLLEHMGYEVTGTAESGEEAIEMAKTNGPDLVLMDIRLKGKMDGVEAARRIHEMLGIPVVYITGYSDTATLERVKESVHSGLLQKPVSEYALRQAIEDALKTHS